MTSAATARTIAAAPGKKCRSGAWNRAVTAPHIQFFSPAERKSVHRPEKVWISERPRRNP